jgi:2-oxoglutarate dehydrogenase E2 component (dihydrolipoamide succinyltransferase)
MSQLEIKVPPVGESITEVTIGSWVKKDGESVKRDEIICSLDSDKASFEVAAEADGILRIKAQEGDTLPIGGLIAVLEAVGAAVGSQPVAVDSPQPVVSSVPLAAAPPVPSSSPSKIVEMKVPTVGESVTEVTIASWNKKNGEMVQLDEVLCELESDKATFELPAEAAGILHIVAEAGTTLPIGALICKIEVGAGQQVALVTPTKEESMSSPSPTTSADVHASPVAAKILAEKGIDPATVAGTGAGGKIMKEDALKAGQSAASSQQPRSSETQISNMQSNTVKPVAPPPGAGGASRRVKMTSLRKTIAKRLVAVKNETAMLTTFNEVDMKPVMDLRGKYKDKFKEKHGVGLGFMSFFTKAIATALLEFPVVNAYIDGDEIVYNDFADISIAVSTERGLVVPVVRNAHKMTFAEIEKEIIRLAGLARDNKLTIDQMQGGTFTITNGGIFGSMLSTPIINAPQSAILGMHNIVERPVVIDGQVAVRPIMYVALSYDHRIIDGRDSVSFLVRVKQLLEDPARLLLEV